MMNREHYFFFNEEGMPIAVFLAKVQWEAINLFVKLYRRPWSESLDMGITVEREVDVSIERWDEIHDRFFARRVPIKPVIIPVVKSAITMIKSRKPDEYQTSGLESAKYMSRM